MTRFLALIALIAVIASVILGASASEAATPAPPSGRTSVNVATCNTVVVTVTNLAPRTEFVAVAGNATAKATTDVLGTLSATFTRIQIGGLTGSAYSRTTAGGINTSNIVNFTITACPAPAAAATPAAATPRPAASTPSVGRLPSTSTND
jgi:hypothetical protein